MAELTGKWYHSGFCLVQNHQRCPAVTTGGKKCGCECHQQQKKERT